MNRTSAIQSLIDREHFRYSLFSTNGKVSGLLRVTNLRVKAGFSPGRVWEIGLRDFARFLTECLSVTLKSDAEGTDLLLEIEPALPSSGFQAEIGEQEIRICASGERGLVEALHYLEREMADRGCPCLPLGGIKRFPTLQTRFTEGTFIPAHQNADCFGDLSEEYLGLMTHFGANAMKATYGFNKLWRSDSLPELNTENFEETCGKIRRHAQRLADHGLDFYFVLHAGALPSRHPVFQSHPEILGAREEIFLEELSGADRCVMCTSHPLVLRAYGEALESIFRNIPELAGVVMIVGGEGFRHCFMRPNVSGGQSTNCPHCQGQDPHEHVANLVNTLAAALKRVDRKKRLLAWPYSAFIWSKDDPTDSRWISHLNPDVEVLSNFDCNDVDPTTHGGAYLFDYNIKIAGPSSRFAAQAALCLKQGNPILAKTESNTTPDTFFLPYLPVYFRWYERFRAIRESGAVGFMGQWRFYGMAASLPEELQYHSVWNPERSAEELLRSAAQRDFRIDAATGDQVVEGWRKLSKAWDSFPYSAMTGGEVEAYMRGPWYLGPAHPLIFNEQSPYDLGADFFKRRGDLGESLSTDKIRLLPGKPRYVCNLLLCLPFGVEQYLEYARRCRDEWDAGLAVLEAALPLNQRTKEAEREIGICKTIAIHLHTLVNTVEFFRLRDSLSAKPVSPEQFEIILGDLRALLDREIANAQRAIPLLENDPRIGYGFTYGEVYNAEMVRQKIRQCEFVRDRELPRIGSVIRFHVWQKYP
jgi:hypothetical protein